MSEHRFPSVAIIVYGPESSIINLFDFIQNQSGVTVVKALHSKSGYKFVIKKVKIREGGLTNSPVRECSKSSFNNSNNKKRYNNDSR